MDIKNILIKYSPRPSLFHFNPVLSLLLVFFLNPSIVSAIPITKWNKCNLEELDLRKLISDSQISSVDSKPPSEDENTLLMLYQFALSQLPPAKKCINKIKFSQFRSLFEGTKKLRWHELQVSQVYEIIEILHHNYPSWVADAIQKHSNSTFNFCLKSHNNYLNTNYRNIFGIQVDFIVRPDGKLYIKIGNKPIGKGTTKQAEVAFSLKNGIKTEEVKTKVLLSLSPEERGSSREKELQEELEIYSVIEKYRKSLPKDVIFEGLARAHELNLTDFSDVYFSEIEFTAIVQKKYETDIENYSLFYHPRKQNILFRKIALGLTHLHAMGLIHGDFKDSNILVNPSTEEVAIADFGLTTDPRIRVYSRTSASHEAPEMVDADNTPAKSLDQVILFQKRDVYGFGIILLKSMGGEDRIPFLKCRNLSINEKNEFTYKPSNIENVNTHGSWGLYGICIQRAATNLHRYLSKNIDEYCRLGKEYCPFAVMTDALDPNPRTRITAKEAARRLGADVSLIPDLIE